MQGLGVVCNKEEGFGEDDFVVEFLGEVWLYIYMQLFIHDPFGVKIMPCCIQKKKIMPC
jgi:hypothetical protein